MGSHCLKLHFAVGAAPEAVITALISCPDHGWMLWS